MHGDSPIPFNLRGAQIDRAEFARRLGAPSSLTNEGRASQVRIEAADPVQFIREFVAAVAGGGEVFLYDPRWSEAERAGLQIVDGGSLLVDGRGGIEVARDVPGARENASRGLPAEAGKPAFGGAGGDQGRVPPPQPPPSSQISALKSQIPSPADAGTASARDATRALGEGWLMIPTGGTSGKIRFARHDEQTISATVAGFAQHFGVMRVNCAGVLPLHHVSGLMAWLRSALTGGEYQPLDWKRLEAGVLPPLPARPEGWFLSLVPTQLERLLHAPATVEWLRGFRTIFLGGAPAWPDLLDRAAAAQLPLSLSYGMTETAAMVTALQPHEFLLGARSSGTALPHATVETREDGTIRVGGASVFRGYWPEFRAERAFDTPDLGELDARGQLRVLGRRDDVIISGGEKIDPLEVEAALRATGEFADVAVLGLPHAEWGSELVAVFARQDSPDIAKVRAALEETLAPYKRPKRYLAVADWPRTAAGKLRRFALIAQIEGL